MFILLAMIAISHLLAGSTYDRFDKRYAHLSTVIPNLRAVYALLDKLRIQPFSSNIRTRTYNGVIEARLLKSVFSTAIVPRRKTG